MDSYDSRYPLKYYEVGTTYMFFISKWPANRLVPDEKDIQQFAGKLEQALDQPGEECRYEKRHIGIVIKKKTTSEQKKLKGILRECTKIRTKKNIKAKCTKVYQKECKKRGYDGTINVLFSGMADGKRVYFETRFITGRKNGVATDDHEQYRASVEMDMSQIVISMKKVQKSASIDNDRRH